MLRLIETSIRCCVILLLIWTPFAFGAVHAWAYALLMIHAFLLAGLRCIHSILVRRPYQGEWSPLPSFVYTPLALPLALFIALLLWQLLPLPASLISYLSPSTAELYASYRPGWPDAFAPLSFDTYATWLALGKLLAYTIFFFLLVNIVRSQAGVRTLYVVIVGTACAVAILGILQKLSGTLSIYWLRETTYSVNLFGPYINGNHFAGYQIMALPIGLGLLLTEAAATGRDRAHGWRLRLHQLLSFFSPRRLLLIYALAIMAEALFLSRSRAGLLGFFLGCAILWLMSRTRRRETERRPVIWIALTVMLGMMLWLGIGPLWQRFQNMVQGTEHVLVADRLPLNMAAWQLFKDFPIFGVGFDAFSSIFSLYQPADLVNKFYTHVHNDYLQLLAETGIVGFGLLVGGLLLCMRSIIRRWRTRRDPFIRVMVAAGCGSIVAMGVVSVVDFNLHIPANALLFTTVLALTYACAYLPHRHQQEVELRRVYRGRWRRFGQRLAPWGGLVVALWLMTQAWQVFMASLHYPQHYTLHPKHPIYQADVGTKRQRLLSALSWAPYDPGYRQSLAELEAQDAREALLRNGRSDEALPRLREQFQKSVSYYERALQTQPTIVRSQLGRLYGEQSLLALGLPQEDLTADVLQARYLDLARLAPFDPGLHYYLGYLLLYADVTESEALSAERFFRQVINLDAAYDEQILKAYREVLPQSEAIRRFTQVMPDTPQGHLRVAQLLEPFAWFHARLHYRAALVLSQEEPEMLQAYGAALLRHKDVKAARDIWQRLAQLTPQEPSVFRQLTKMHRQLGNHEAAVETLTALVKLEPKRAELHRQLAGAHSQSGNATAAEDAWQRVIALEPNRVESYLQLVRLYESRQDLAAARNLMQQVVVIAPDKAEYHRDLARLYAQSGQHRDAFYAYKQLEPLRPGDPQVFYQLGEYLQQDGQFALAVDYYQQALRLKPDDPKYQNALQYVLKQIKN